MERSCCQLAFNPALTHVDFREVTIMKAQLTILFTLSLVACSEPQNSSTLAESTLTRESEQTPTPPSKPTDPTASATGTSTGTATECGKHLNEKFPLKRTDLSAFNQLDVATTDIDGTQYRRYALLEHKSQPDTYLNRLRVEEIWERGDPDNVLISRYMSVVGSYLIKTRDTSTKAESLTFPAIDGDVTARRISDLPIFIVQVGDTDADPNGIIAVLADNPAVESVEPNYIVKEMATTSDPCFSRQWHLKNSTSAADIDALGAWETTTCNDTQIVAVIDSGMDLDHPDLKGHLWKNPGETAAGAKPGRAESPPRKK